MTAPTYTTLQEYMEKTGQTQEQVAALLGVRQGHISNILNRRRGVSLAFAFHVEQTLGVDAASFIVTRAEKERNRRGPASTDHTNAD